MYFISNTIGKDYVSQKPFNMRATFEDTNNRTPPVIFVLFAGVDPAPWVERLGKEMGLVWRMSALLCQYQYEPGSRSSGRSNHDASKLPPRDS